MGNRFLLMVNSEGLYSQSVSSRADDSGVWRTFVGARESGFARLRARALEEFLVMPPDAPARTEASAGVIAKQVS